MSKASIETDFRDYGLSYPLCKAKQTNAGRIRSMSDEELVEFFSEKMDCAACPASEDVACEHDRCLENIKEWLEREVEE